MKTPVSAVEAFIHKQVACICANIIQYYDYKDESLYMEFADRGDGESLLKSLEIYGRYEEKHLIKLFFQLITAVHAMHSNGWAHRDIKPANVLIFSSKMVKLCDFGSAKRFFDPCNSQSLHGTPAYMSPALLTAHDMDEAQTHSDPFQDDIYALGSTIFSFASLAILSDFGIIGDEVGDMLLENYVRAGLEPYSQDLQDIICEMVKREGNLRITAQKALEMIENLIGSVERSIGPPCVGCNEHSASVEFHCRHRVCKRCSKAWMNSGGRCRLCNEQI
jgi:serine/threonine protein kinase